MYIEVLAWLDCHCECSSEVSLLCCCILRSALKTSTSMLSGPIYRSTFYYIAIFETFINFRFRNDKSLFKKCLLIAFTE